MKLEPAGPRRTCLGCRAGRSQGRLRRLALIYGPDGPRVVWDDRRALGGRGAWICPEAGCLEKALRPKVLARAFRLNREPDTAALRAALRPGSGPGRGG